MFQFICRCSRQLGFLCLLISFNLAYSQTPSLASLGSHETSLRLKTPIGGPDVGDPASIMAQFVEAETRVREALKQNTFKRDVVLQTIGPNGEVTGEYIRNSQFIFDDKGRRIERVLFHPASTIHEMRITKEDIQDLAGSQLLGIDVTEANKYILSYAGRMTIDSRDAFAIDVRPATQPDPSHMKERYFVGRVWIDTATFQIVKVKGIVEPQGKQRFPVFETWREAVNGALAFPTRTEADDILHFLGRDVHYRIKVRYYDYKLFGSKVTVKEIDEVPNDLEQPSPRTDNVRPEPAKPASKTGAAPPNSAPPSIIRLPKKEESCDTNRNSPPVGPYHWPADTEVKVYFVRNMFTADQRATMLDAMKAWSMASEEISSGVRFVDAGETEVRMNCRSCLTVERRDVYKQDKHHYAFFYPMSEDEGRLLVSAWIDLDFGITSPKALQGFMVHELGHGLGLWDCTTCKKKLTIMNGFPGINKDNGLVSPSRCDLATVRDVYLQERQLASARLGGGKTPDGAQSNSVFAVMPRGLDKGSSSALDLQRPLADRALTTPSHLFSPRQ